MTKTLSHLLHMMIAATVFSQPVVSPEIHPDRSVTFRLYAPHAGRVELCWEGTKNPAVKYPVLKKGKKSVWSVTMPPMQPDIYAYSFDVDGLRVLDPGNPWIKYTFLYTENQFHIPGPDSLPWEINDVPRGRVHEHFYKSAVVGDERHFYVYTPPDYDTTAKQPYPVLYLLHGLPDADDGWITAGRANVILDNLIAHGKARPMVVVMPLGYGNWQVVKEGFASY